jgi:hypothetical protein
MRERCYNQLYSGQFFSVFAFTAAAAAAATAEITWVSFERTMGLPEPQLVLARPKHRERETER